MIRVIEQSESAFVQKVYTPKGATVAYQVVPRDKLGDSSAIQRFPTLKSARDLLAAFKTTQGE